jgi:hypothetical protein
MQNRFTSKDREINTSEDLLKDLIEGLTILESRFDDWLSSMIGSKLMQCLRERGTIGLMSAQMKLLRQELERLL